MKIFGVTGTKNTGKTTLVTLIVQELTKRGYHVGTIKHTHHDFDLKEKDTGKHREAGAELVVGAGKNTFFQVKGELKFENIIKIINNMKKLDYIIFEGFKYMNYPKISTIKARDDYTITNVNVFELDQKDIDALINLVEKRTYSLIPGANCGKCGYENCQEMAKAIIRGETREENCKMRKIKEVELYIDDENIPLSPFVQDILKKTVLAMVKTLKTPNKEVTPEKVELMIRNGED